MSSRYVSKSSLGSSKAHFKENLSDSKLRRSNKTKSMLTWFSSSKSRKGRSLNYDIKENPKAASRASTRVRFGKGPPPSKSSQSASPKLKGARPTSFLGMTLKRKKKKKQDEKLQDMIDLFNQSDFEFEMDKENKPENIDMLDQVEDCSREHLIVHNEENKERMGTHIRDTYLTQAEEASAPYEKHLSISSTPNLKFSMISTAAEREPVTSASSLESLPLPPPLPPVAIDTEYIENV